MANFFLDNPDIQFHFKRLKLEEIVGIAEDDYEQSKTCLLYTSDAADERSSVDLGGRRIIKKKKNQKYEWSRISITNITYNNKQNHIIIT